MLEKESNSDTNREITIHKQKDSWSREEVINLINDWRKESGENSILTSSKFDNWIEENL